MACRPSRVVDTILVYRVSNMRRARPAFDRRDHDIVVDADAETLPASKCPGLPSAR